MDRTELTTQEEGVECVCIGFDGSGPEVFDKVWRKARKKHRCCECGETIRPGQVYECVKGLWDGCWAEYKTCTLCVKIRGDPFPLRLYLWFFKRRSKRSLRARAMRVKLWKDINYDRRKGGHKR